MTYQQHLAKVVRGHGVAAATHVIEEIVAKGLEAKYEAKEQRYRETHPERSLYVSLANKPACQIHHEIAGTPKTDPLTLDSLVNFEVGEAVEDRFLDIFEWAGAKIVRQHRVIIPFDGEVITGRIDALATFPDLHMMIEVKSINSRSMGFMVRNGEPGREDHRMQLLMYLHESHVRQGQQALGLYSTDTTYDHGILFYGIKDAVKGEPVLHAFYVKYDKAKAEQELARMVAAARNGDPGVPQKFIDHKKSKGKLHWRCLYCPYKTMHWPEG